jgi:hypothetical protein
MNMIMLILLYSWCFAWFLMFPGLETISFTYFNCSCTYFHKIENTPQLRATCLALIPLTVSSSLSPILPTLFIILIRHPFLKKSKRLWADDVDLNAFWKLLKQEPKTCAVEGEETIVGQDQLKLCWNI